MLLYDFPHAPSPRRVRIFLAEKDTQLPVQTVDLRSGEQFSPRLSALESCHTVPVLELDDGTCLSESMAICRYLEALHPQPPLLGSDAREQGLVEMWNRRIELQGYLAIFDAYRNSTPALAGRALPGVTGGVEQIPALVERGRAGFVAFLERLEPVLGVNEFVAGRRFSVADITLLVTIDFAARVDLGPSPGQSNLRNWYDAVAARPSARA